MYQFKMAQNYMDLLTGKKITIEKQYNCVENVQ